MVRFIHCFRSICVGYSVRAGLFYLYFPVRECDRMWCLAFVYCRPSCAACISGYGGDVAVRCLVWMSLGICFWCDLVVLPILSYDFWVRVPIRNSVCDPNILAIRQQTRKGSEMVSDIFETQFYCMVQMLWLFHVFHFWTTAVKKAGVLNLLLCCLTVFCCEWQSFVFVWQSGGWGTTQIVGYKLL